MCVYTRHGYLISAMPNLGWFPVWAIRWCGGPGICDACQGDLVHFQQTGYYRFPPCGFKGCENDMSEMKCPNEKTLCLDHCGDEDHKEKEETNMEIKRFQRKTFEVEAVHVTDENINEVAKWVGGYVSGASPTPSGRNTRYVKVNVQHPLNDEQTKAYVGTWVLKSDKGFKVYKDRPFKANFDEVKENVFVNGGDAAWAKVEELSAKLDEKARNIFRESEDDLEELRVTDEPVDVKDAVSGAGRNDG